ncbi:MAG TPA: VWA domain-containing protein [Gemmataceae bacterium]|nr:VWA domain-containing protein [Gemmataceae bacterium]
MHERAARGNSRHWQGWKVSLALHALLGSAILFTLWRVPLPDSSQLFNTRMTGPQDEFCVTICEEPVHKMRPQAAPPPQLLPEKVIEPLPTLPELSGPDKHVQPAEMIEPKSASHDNSPSGSGSNGGNNFRSHENHLPVPVSARSVVFVLDRSASMGIGNKMEIARREILATLARMSSSSRFQVVVYNRQAEMVRINGHTGMAVVTERNLQELWNFLSDLTPEGGNDNLRALREAISLQPDVICLLSDADELTSAEVRTITNWNHGLSSIHAVTIGAAPREMMQLLAKLNRGACKMIDAR